MERRTKQALANVAPLGGSCVSELEIGLEGLDLGVLSSSLAPVRETLTKMHEANIRASSRRFQDETRGGHEDVFAVLAAAGYGGMGW